MRLADWFFRLTPTYHAQQGRIAFLERVLEFEKERLQDARHQVDLCEAAETAVRKDLVAALEQMSQMVRDGFRAPYRPGQPGAVLQPEAELSEDEQTIHEAIGRRASLNSELGRVLLRDAKRQLDGGASAEEVAGSILRGAPMTLVEDEEPEFTEVDLDVDDDEAEPADEEPE